MHNQELLRNEVLLSCRVADDRRKRSLECVCQKENSSSVEGNFRIDIVISIGQRRDILKGLVNTKEPGQFLPVFQVSSCIGPTVIRARFSANGRGRVKDEKTAAAHRITDDRRAYL